MSTNVYCFFAQTENKDISLIVIYSEANYSASMMEFIRRNMI